MKPFLLAGECTRVTEDTGEFPGERIRCGFVCTHSSVYTLAPCIRGKMEGLSVSVAFPLARLYQEGKKKLISDLSRSVHSGVIQSRMPYASYKIIRIFTIAYREYG